MTRTLARMTALGAALLALASCGGASRDKSLDSLNADMLDTGGNAAVTAALNDQIMVDPSLASQSNADAIRPPHQPYSAPVPPDDIAKRPPPADGDKLLRAPAAVAAQGCTQCRAADDSTTLGALAGQQDGGAVEERVRQPAAGWRVRRVAHLFRALGQPLAEGPSPLSRRQCAGGGGQRKGALCAARGQLFDGSADPVHARLVLYPAHPWRLYGGASDRRGTAYPGRHPCQG